jgi:sulfatase maturation enzyme AslB (radical SAM superfamily)
MASIEWLLTEKCNFNCSYCGLYNNLKTPETDEVKLRNFILKVKTLQQKLGLEFFIFGGEPFLHTKIDFVLELLQKYNIDYKFQTNLSNFSVNKIIQLSKTQNIKKLNVSVHLTQQSINTYISNIEKLIKNNINLEEIQIMFSHNIISEYLILKEKFPDNKIVIYSISDFLVSGFGDVLKEFNILKQTSNYNFERIKVKHPITSELTDRSYVWEEFIDKKISPKGEICLLKDNFFMFDSKLNTFNCCFHEFIKDSICPFDTCFLS